VIRVATYNILHASLKGLEAIADVFRGIDPDLVALQEVDRGVPRSGSVDQPAWLGDRLGLHHAFATAVPWEGGEYGLAILSRFPILGTRAVHLPSRAILALADGAEPRVLLSATVDAPGGPLTFGSTHLGLHPTERILQAEAIAAQLTRRQRTLLCGDLNEGHTEPAYLRLTGAGLVDCLGECGALPLRTYPSHAPTIGIDHVLRSADLPVPSRARAVETNASDHLPVVVDLG